jgi:hypothetical protein
MKKHRIVITCAEAAPLAGPGTQIYWRPDNRARRGPLSGRDPAEILHESGREDTTVAILALQREDEEKLRLGALIAAQRTILEAQPEVT